MNSGKNKYVNELKQLFPFNDSNVRKLIFDISQDIDELSLSSSLLTYEDICREIGAPREICYTYLESLSGQELSNKISIAQFRKVIATIVVAFVILLLSCESVWFYHLYHQAANSLPVYYQEQISDVQT